MYNDEWQMSQIQLGDVLPLGADAESLIWENPEWAIYLRRDERFQCPHHYDPSSKSPLHFLKFCPICLGFGVKTTPLIIPTRVNLGPAKISIRESDVRLDPGYVQYFATSID